MCLAVIFHHALIGGGVHASEAGTCQHFFVCNLLFPPKFENTTETSDVEVLILFSCFFDKVQVLLPYRRVLPNTNTINSRICVDG